MSTNQTQLLYPRGVAAASTAVAATQVAAEARKRLARAIAALPGRVRRRVLYLRTVRELQALSDHTLRDIGIERSTIPQVVANALERS